MNSMHMRNVIPFALSVVAVGCSASDATTPTFPPRGEAQATTETVNQAVAPPSRPEPDDTLNRAGMYGREAVSLWGQVAWRDRVATAASPGDRSRVTARFIEGPTDRDESFVRLDISGAIGRHQMRLVPGAGTEVLWRPAGDALMVSTSGAGLNGPWHLIVVGRFGGRLQERDLTMLIARRYGVPYRCDFPEAPNIAGIGWLPNGHILAAAETVHHSVCDAYGTFKAYEVDPMRMRIVREYDQIEAKRRFGPMLGTELAHAPDRCVIRPADCRVADGYHGE